MLNNEMYKPTSLPAMKSFLQAICMSQFTFNYTYTVLLLTFDITNLL